MAFKTDWSFLDKISMGAVGTQAVINQLNAMGHHIIELERYCTSNKIWATKIKRLRIPDLLCLHCGRRIESRAKSKLGIIMSDSEKNDDRRWFCGLRDTDWVAFIQCFRDVQNNWIASDAINMFSVGAMKETEGASQLGPPKSVFEGAERDRKWECYISSGSGTGTVVAIEDAPNGKKYLRMQSADGRKQSKAVDAGHYVYIKKGEEFIKGTKILSGIVPPVCDCGCSDGQYDFFADLSSEENETVYTAVKALGYLTPSERATNELQLIAHNDNADYRIRLEAYASLLKLNVDVWEEMYRFVFSLDSIEMKTEYVLILGEIPSPVSAEYLFRVLQHTANPEELRAAAVWAITPTPDLLSRVFPFCFAQEQIVANHTMAKIKRHFCSTLTATVLEAFCDDECKNAICAFLLSTASDVNCEAVVMRYLTASKETQDWILYAIGISPKENYSELIDRLDPNAAETKSKLMLLWKCQPAFLTSAEMDNVAFLEKQK